MEDSISRPPLRGAPPRKDDGTRINNDIRVLKVRLIDENGEMLGIYSTHEAQKLADEAGLDLVEISPHADPPVCKILDYGKFKYEQQKKANEARKKQKVIEVKEIKIRPAIGDHDYEVKLRAAKKFLNDENKVKVTLRLRGREIAHKDLAMEILERFKGDLAELAKVDQEPKLEGRQVIMMLSPEKAA